jgi:hypothetical protein
MFEEIFLRHPGIPIQQVEQLAFHQIDFGQGKAEPIEAFDRGIARPMLVLGAGVVQVLGG